MFKAFFSHKTLAFVAGLVFATVAGAGVLPFGDHPMSAFSPAEGTYTDNDRTFTLTNGYKGLDPLAPTSDDSYNRSEPGFYLGVDIEWQSKDKKAIDVQVAYQDNLGRTIPQYDIADLLHKELLDPKGCGISHVVERVATRRYMRNTRWWVYLTPSMAYQLYRSGQDFQAELTIKKTNKFKLVIPNSALASRCLQATPDTLTIECFGESLTAQLKPASDPVYFTGNPIEVAVEYADEIAKVTGGSWGEVRYFDAAGNPLSSAPVNAGSYVAKQDFTFGGETFTLTKEFTVQATPMSAVTLTLKEDEFTYDGTLKSVRGDVTKLEESGYELVAGVDYVLGEESVMAAVGEPKRDSVYSIRLIGVGNFTGEQTITWRILTPCRAFDDDALSSLGNGTVSGNLLVLSEQFDWVWYSAENAPDGSGIAGWYAGAKIDWPYTTSVFTKPEYAHFQLSRLPGEDYTGEEVSAGAVTGLSLTTGHCVYDYVMDCQWWERITPEDVTEAAKAGDTTIVRMLTVGGDSWLHDTKGLRDTDYVMTASFAGLELRDGDGKLVYPLPTGVEVEVYDPVARSTKNETLNDLDDLNDLIDSLTAPKDVIFTGTFDPKDWPEDGITLKPDIRVIFHPDQDTDGLLFKIPEGSDPKIYGADEDGTLRLKGGQTEVTLKMDVSYCTPVVGNGETTAGEEKPAIDPNTDPENDLVTAVETRKGLFYVLEACNELDFLVVKEGPVFAGDGKAVQLSIPKDEAAKWRRFFRVRVTTHSDGSL